MILNIFKDASESKGNIDDLVKSYKNLNIEQTVAKMKADELAEAEIRATLSKQGYVEADIEQAIALKNSNAAKTTNITLTKLQSAGYATLTVLAKAANIALNAGIGILISLVATGVIKWLDDFINREEKLAEAAKEARDKIEELNESFVNQKKTVSDYANEYAELAQGVDLLTNKNLSLSTEDYERFLELSNTLSETFPTLTKRVDDNGNAILDLGGNVDSIVGSLNNLIEAQQRLANQDIAKEFPKVYKEYYSVLEKTNSDIEEQLKEQEELAKARDTLLGSSFIPLNDTQGEEDYYEALRKLGFDNFGELITTNEDGVIGKLFNVDNLDSDEDVIEKYNELFDKSLENVKVYNDNLQIKSSELNRAMSALLSTDYDFTNNLNTSEIQAGVTELFNSFDLSSLPEEIDASSGEQVYNYLRKIYLLPISKLSDDVQEELSKVFSKPADMPDVDYIDLVDEMQSYFDEHNIEISLDFIVEDEKDLQERLSNVISNITDNIEVDKDLLTGFLNTEGIDTSSEIEFFIDVTKGAESATEAINMYSEAVKKSKEYADIDNDAIIDGLSEIRSAYNTVADAVEQYRKTKHLTLETIENLLSLDDKYLTYLYDENGQLTLNTEAYNALTQAKLNEMYVSIVNDAMQTIDSLSNEADATHYLKLMNMELTEVNWDLASSELAVAQAELEVEKARGNKTSAREQAFADVIAEAQKRVNLLKEATTGMKFDDFYDSGSSSKKTKDEFSKEFDWIENSVDNVNRVITNLNETLSNTTGFKERLKAYDDLIKADSKLIETTKKAATAYEREWNKASSKISSGYKNKIVSGETFSVETITNETTADNIDTAQDAYEKWQSMLQQYNKAVQQKVEDEQGRVQVLLDLEQIRLDILSLENQEKMTAKEKNNYIKQEVSLKKNILKYNLQLAESEEEKKKLQKEYNEYLKENQTLIYENNKEERDNKISYYDSRIQDIQNAIDLSEARGGQGTENQYAQMNEYIEKQKEFERQNYDAALKMRSNATYGTEEWDKYNQEIQTAQDNIYDLTTAQIENNRTILKLPIQAIEKQNELLQERLDILNETKEKVEDSISSASNIVQNQINTLNKQKEVTEEYWNSQIDAINEQKDALTKANEEIEHQLALEKAQYNFEKAQGQKTTKIYREGQGFVFEADQDALRDAQEELDTQTYNSAIYKLEVQLDALEKSKEEATSAIENQINSLELYKDRIDSITEGYEKMLQLQTLISMFGTDAEEKLMNGDLSIIDEMKNIYNETVSQADSLQLQIEANEKAIEQIENYADKWNGSSKTIVEAKQLIEQTVSDNTKEIESIQQRTEAVKTINDAWEGTKTKLEEELGFIQENQIVAKDEEQIILGERLENIKTFSQKAAQYLKEITTALSQAETKQAELNKVSAENAKLEKTISNNKTTATVTVNTMGKKHSGMASGYVGESEKKDAFKYIALSELKPEEIPTVLLKGEAVLSQEDISNVLSNMKNSLIGGISIGTNLASDINLNTIKQKPESVNKTIEFNGDIVLQNVQSPDTLARQLKDEFLIRLDQEFYK